MIYEGVNPRLEEMGEWSRWIGELPVTEYRGLPESTHVRGI